MNQHLEIGCPVVLKIVSPDIAHKTEVGGIVLNVKTPRRPQPPPRNCWSVWPPVPNARLTGVLVAPMSRPGIETICGVFTDPVFGPMVMFGLGGIHVEVLRDVAFRLAPFDGQWRARWSTNCVAASCSMAYAARRQAMLKLSSERWFVCLSSRPTTTALSRRWTSTPFIVLPRGEGGYALDA